MRERYDTSLSRIRAAATMYVAPASWLVLTVTIVGAIVAARFSGDAGARRLDMRTAEARAVEARIARDAGLGQANEETSAVASPQVPFDELGLELVGIMRLSGEDSAFIRSEGGGREAVYQTGDTIEGYTLVLAGSGLAVFEGDGERHALRLDSEPAAPFEVAANVIFSNADALPDLPEVEDEFEIKRRVETTKIAMARARTGQVVAGIAPEEQFVRAPLLSEVAAAAGPGPIEFIMPLEGRISSKFGYRKQPMGGARRYHQGIDIAAPYRSPIEAMADGRVAKVSSSWAKGLNVLIEHRDGYATAYFHLARAMVKPGQWVRQGKIIALEGSSGNSTGPHLHFEILKNGAQVNPALFLPQLK